MDIKRRNPQSIPVRVGQHKPTPAPQARASQEVSDTLTNMWSDRDEQRAKNARKKGMVAFIKNNILVLSILLVVVVVGVLIALFRTPVEQPDTIVSETPETDNPIVVADDGMTSELPFDPSSYYGVATTQGNVYFAHIVDVDATGYHLEHVFYEEARIGADQDNADQNADSRGQGDQRDGITLVKFGTEAYQPEDTLVLPESQITQVFPLRENSPILQAINEYSE